jgi:23S rRNA (guanosine2251-2'-O)-methyltransferase
MRVVAAIGEQEAVGLDEADLRDGVFILIGGERRGVTRSFVDEADARVRIAYGRDDAPDLGAASAAAVIGFAALRQRRETPT